jgi:hypothetical protein
LALGEREIATAGLYEKVINVKADVAAVLVSATMHQEWWQRKMRPFGRLVAVPSLASTTSGISPRSGPEALIINDHRSLPQSRRRLVESCGATVSTAPGTAEAIVETNHRS